MNQIQKDMKPTGVEEVVAKAHIKWLSKAKTAQFKDSGEMTVLPYGYLSQALTEELTTQHLAHEAEKKHLVEAILEKAPGFENTITHDVSYEVGVIEYMARIKTIAKSFNINLD